MYKSKLNELCQRHSVPSPEYHTARDGPDHSARFTATVTVNGVSFQSPPNQCRSAKDAQNLASRFAYEYFTANPPVLHSPLPSRTTGPPDPPPPGVAASEPVLQSLAQPVQPFPTTAPVHFAAAPAFLPPQLEQTPPSVWLAGPQPVHPPLFQQTQSHNPSSPPKNLTEAPTPNTTVGQSKESNVQTSEVTPLSSREPAKVKGMYKSKLLELCHKHAWTQPEYTTVKEGPDHSPRFGATVIVNGIPFKTPNNECHSSKEATNLAACIALDHLSASNQTVPQQCHFPSMASSSSGQADQSNGTTPVVGKEIYKSSDIQPMYKNQLQQYAQKQNIAFPEYSCEIDGPPHARRFRSKVAFGGQIFESQEFFSTVKEAEQAAAKIALEALSPNEIQKGGGLFKTLLQQLVQKEGFLFPVYKTIQSGPPHAPTFVSTVEVGVETFQGQEAKSKKQAEMNAAEVAYNSRMNGTTDISSKRQKISSEQSTNSHSPTPFQRSTNPAMASSLQIPAVKEIDKIVVSQQHNSNVAVPDSILPSSIPVLPDNQSSTPLKLENLTSSIQGFDQKKSGARDMVLVYTQGSNEVLPNNASVLPCSDNNWAAVQVELNKNDGHKPSTSCVILK